MKRAYTREKPVARVPFDRDACVPEGEVPCEAGEGSQRARGAVGSLLRAGA